MSRCFGIFWLSGWLITQVATAQISRLHSLTPDQQVHWLWVVSKNWGKDSLPALRQLDSIRQFAQKQDDERLLWYVNLHRIRCRVRAEDLLRKPIKAYKGTEPYMEQCPVPVVRASYYCSYGQWCYGNGEPEKGLKYLLQAKYIFETIGYANIPEAIEYLNIFGHYYYYHEDYPKALYYLEQVRKTKNDGLIWSYASLVTVGLAHRQLKNYPKAEQAFLEALPLAKAANNTAWVGIIYGNLGNLYKLMGQPQKALTYLYSELGVKGEKSTGHSALTCLHIAQIFLSLNHLDQARAFIDRSEKLTTTHYLIRDRPSKVYLTEYYKTKTAYYKKIGDYQRATTYLDSITLLSNPLEDALNHKILTNVETSVKADQYLSDIRQVELEQKYDRIIRRILISMLLLLGLAIGYGVRQFRHRQRIQAEQREQAEHRLHQAQVQLEQYVDSLKSKNELITQISEELAAVRYETDVVKPEQTERITTLLNSVILTDKDWIQFRQLFEQAYPGFFEKIYQACPDLTPAEIRLLTLLKLEIPNKEMGIMLGVSADSIRKSRYRLRKKLETSQISDQFQPLIRQV